MSTMYVTGEAGSDREMLSAIIVEGGMAIETVVVLIVA